MNNKQSFASYEKMPDNLRKLNLSLADTRRLELVDWVVTEKIHGANFSFVYDGENLRFAKRREMLDWDDDFFGFQVVVERLESAVMQVFTRLALQYAFKTATIYGELYGGAYPHPEVPQDPRFSAIQTGVYYSPNIEFCAFDIALTPQRAEHARFYLDFGELVKLCAAAGLPFAQPLLIGKLNQALFFDKAFDSKIPDALGLPALPANLVEGIVLKPYRNIEVKVGDAWMRPILKLKNAAFAEAQFHAALAWSFPSNATSSASRLSFLLPELKGYVNRNRLESTISKIGGLKHADQNRFYDVCHASAVDALDSFLEDFGELQHEFSQEDRQYLLVNLKVDVGKLLREYLEGKPE